MSYAASGAIQFVPVLVFITGLVISLVTRARHPKRSTFAAIAFCIFIVGGLGTAGWSFVGIALIRGDSFSMYSALSGLVYGVAMLLNVAGWVTMLLALFKADGAARPAQPVQPSGYQVPFPPQQPPSPQPPSPGQRPAGY